MPERATIDHKPKQALDRMTTSAVTSRLQFKRRWRALVIGQLDR
jgi:hypothetical protein